MLLVQSEAAKHWTHWPVSLQSLPSLYMHAVPAASGVFTGMPLLQASVVHGEPSSGISVSSGTTFVLPWPSQTTLLQSQFSWPVAVTVPSATLSTPHFPAVHVRFWHEVSCPGQSA